MANSLKKHLAKRKSKKDRKAEKAFSKKYGGHPYHVDTKTNGPVTVNAHSFIVEEDGGITFFIHHEHGYWPMVYFSAGEVISIRNDKSNVKAGTVLLTEITD